MKNDQKQLEIHYFSNIFAWTYFLEIFVLILSIYILKFMFFGRMIFRPSFEKTQRSLQAFFLNTKNTLEDCFPWHKISSS